MSRYVRHFVLHQWLPSWAVVVLVCAPMGCALFPSLEPATTTSTSRPILPPLQASPEAIQLDVFLLERPADDYLLNTAVWKEVDQIGALTAETRETLRDNGFQLGIVSSNPPPLVQRLLGMVAEIPTESPEFTKPLMGRHQYLSPGVETEIATGIGHEECQFDVRDGDRTKTLEFERASGVLRMKAHRLQDGWIRVDFQPEIHHGDTMMRPTPTEREWSFRGGQNIDVRHAQRFSVTMNVGDMALVTCTANDDPTMGDRFFRYTDRNLKKQRVLVVRIVDAGQSRPAFNQ